MENAFAAARSRQNRAKMVPVALASGAILFVLAVATLAWLLSVPKKVPPFEVGHALIADSSGTAQLTALKDGRRQQVSCRYRYYYGAKVLGHDAEFGTLVEFTANPDPRPSDDACSPDTKAFIADYDARHWSDVLRTRNESDRKAEALDGAAKRIEENIGR